MTMCNGTLICDQCGNTPGWPNETEKAMGLCRDCASKTPGEAKACPSCGCSLVQRTELTTPFRPSEWTWQIRMFDERTNGPIHAIIHWCPEHGCDLEAEFQLALRAKKAGKG